MKDILTRADAISLKTDNIEKLRKLIFDTPEEKFVQLQLKAVRTSTVSFLASLPSVCIGMCRLVVVVSLSAQSFAVCPCYPL
jgi:3-dehydroquinate synthase class II